MEEGHNLNFCRNNRQIIGSQDREVWFGASSFTDPLCSLPTMMHLYQSRKRQNCGSSSHEHLISDLGSGVQLGHEATSHGSRLSSQNFHFHCSEPGTNALSMPPFNNGIATDDSWNSMLSSSPLQQPLINSVRTLVGEQGRNSYKRKSSMYLYSDSFTHPMSCGMGESHFHRSTQGLGTHQSDTSMNSIHDESGAQKDSQGGAYHSIRTSTLSFSRHDVLNNSLTQSNYSTSNRQNERGLTRVLPRSDTINESLGSMGFVWPDTWPLRHGHGLSAATGSWCRSGRYLEESSLQSGFFDTTRILNLSMGANGLRQGEALDMMGVATIDPGPDQPPSRAITHGHFQQFTSEFHHFSSHIPRNPYAYLGTVNRHLPSSPSVQLSNRFVNMNTMTVLPAPHLTPMIPALTSGPRAVFGVLPSVSMPGQLPSRHSEANRTSFLREVSVRGSRVLQSEGVNRRRSFSSHHDLSNQHLPYEWGDSYDEHRDMRLDVDNMSYEELLALEERIGNVKTGLEECNVQNCLKVSTYLCSDVAVPTESSESDSKCSVCQEEYVKGDELGELHCGHGYHTNCIKQWLLLKNQCPICKTAAS